MTVGITGDEFWVCWKRKLLITDCSSRLSETRSRDWGFVGCYCPLLEIAEGVVLTSKRWALVWCRATCFVVYGVEKRPHVGNRIGRTCAITTEQ